MAARGPGVPLLHVGLAVHSPALIFDFEERCLQSGHWKEECARQPSVCPGAEPELRLQEMLRETRLCQSPREREPSRPQGVPFLWLSEAPLPSPLTSITLEGRGYRVPQGPKCTHRQPPAYGC